MGFVLAIIGSTVAQERTVGLFKTSPRAFNGFTLVAPMSSGRTYLIDINGELVHDWVSTYRPAGAAYLLPDGSLLRAADINNPYFLGGGQGGKLERFAWDGSLLWEFQWSGPGICQHHDFLMLPSGNILFIAWERKSWQTAVDAGRKPSSMLRPALWPDVLIEVQPTGPTTGVVVWEWHAWDHLVQDIDPARPNFGNPGGHPEKIDVNYAVSMPQGPDWLHSNSIDYHPGLDLILLSVHNFSEVWVIDHTTTSAEARSSSGGRRGRGGDLLYRWGNPEAYRRGTSADRRLFGQHDAQWFRGIGGDDRILVYNNGLHRPDGTFSTVEEFVPVLDSAAGFAPADGAPFEPAQTAWQYATGIFSKNISGAQRLPNGNTFICDGPRGSLSEIDGDGGLVWWYVNPLVADGPLRWDQAVPGRADQFDNLVFKSRRYARDYPAFTAKALSPRGPLELLAAGISETRENREQPVLRSGYPNPFNPTTTIRYELPSAAHVKLSIHNLLGQEVSELVNEEQQAGWKEVRWHAAGAASGAYLIRLLAGNAVLTKRLVIAK